MKRLLLALSLFTMGLINTAWASECAGPMRMQANLSYSDKYNDGMSVGSVVKRYSEALNGILSQSAFSNVSPLNSNVSLYKDDVSEQYLYLVFTVSFDSSFEALTLLFNARDYLSIDFYDTSPCG